MVLENTNCYGRGCRSVELYASSSADACAKGAGENTDGTRANGNGTGAIT